MAMPKEIQNYLSHLLPLLAMRGIEITAQNEIAYGLQLKLKRELDKANLNIYYSGKRGLSTVVGGAANSLLKQELSTLLTGAVKPDEAPAMHTWYSWIGSDECGKGDYFGPLVVSAFFLRREQETQALQLGVCDSKKLKDTQIISIAKSLYQSFEGQANCLLIKPQRYNELIASFKSQGLNLNDLMAWAHDKVISELLAKHPDCEGVLIDQFSKAQKVKARLCAKHKQLNIVERTRAERDPAVAAASILARYQFLQARKSLDRQYQMTFPLGASSGVIKAAKAFIAQHGSEQLPNVAKVHFKTTAQVMTQELFEAYDFE